MCIRDSSNTEEDMLDTVCSQFDNVIVVVNANNAMELDWVDKYEQIGAVIFAPGALSLIHICCIVCGFSVGIMWPGTISISSKKFPAGGTAMFALLAMAGDLGGSIGPGIVGRVTQNAGDNIRVGMGVGLIFPVVLLVMVFLLKKVKVEEK